MSMSTSMSQRCDIGDCIISSPTIDLNLFLYIGFLIGISVMTTNHDVAGSILGNFAVLDVY